MFFWLRAYPIYGDLYDENEYVDVIENEWFDTPLAEDETSRQISFMLLDPLIEARLNSKPADDYALVLIDGMSIPHMSFGKYTEFMSE